MTDVTARLAGEHFAAAIVFLLAGAIGLVWIAPDLAAGDYLSPRVAAITHLFTLGWITTTIFGALYQLLPVALGAPIRWPRLGHASIAAFAPGIALFVCGVATSSFRLHDVGLGFLTIGIVLALANIGATLPRATPRDETWYAVAVGITFLSSTLVLGGVLLHNVDTAFIAAARLRVLVTHLHVAIVGWALIMIVGVSHRLLPMFLLAHGADTRWTRRALILLGVGLALLAAGVNLRSTAISWLGACLLDLGIAAFIRQAYAFYRARFRKRVDIGLRFAAIALAFLAVAGVLGPILLAHGQGNGRLAIGYVATGLLGGVAFYIVGFFYKIVPLLTWTVRYAAIPGAPMVADLYSARMAEWQLWLMVVGLITLVAGTLSGALPAVVIGAIGLFGGVLLFVGQMARVAFGRHS